MQGTHPNNASKQQQLTRGRGLQAIAVKGRGLGQYHINITRCEHILRREILAFKRKGDLAHVTQSRVPPLYASRSQFFGSTVPASTNLPNTAAQWSCSVYRPQRSVLLAPLGLRSSCPSILHICIHGQLRYLFIPAFKSFSRRIFCDEVEFLKPHMM